MTVIRTAKPRARGAVGWWVCAEFHCFPYGDKAWHQQFTQGLDQGYLVPLMCQWEDVDGPCMDSSHLWGPFRGRQEAEIAAHAKKLVAGAPPLTDEQKSRLALILRPPTSPLGSVIEERGILQAFRNGVLDDK